MAAVATTARTSSTTALPTTQNTALVLEFRCLYTSDLRKKQKRWHDGRLRYHTFNKRVMVYDERSNFVGDAHWREDEALCEGSELELERSGILVDVADCTGRKDQDLSELLDKRLREREERVAARTSLAASSTLREPASYVQQSTNPTPAGTSLRGPRPLHSLLGTPSGHYGRAAVPTTSPYEERLQAMRSVNDSVAAPRVRTEASPPTRTSYAQNLMGATLTLSRQISNKTALRLDPLWSKTSRLHQTIQTVDLSNEEPESTTSLPHMLPSPDDVANRSRIITSKGKRLRETSPPASFARNLTGAMLDLSGASRPRPYLKRRNPAVQPSLSSVESSEFIDIDSIDDGPTIRPTPELKRFSSAKIATRSQVILSEQVQRGSAIDVFSVEGSSSAAAEPAQTFKSVITSQSSTSQPGRRSATGTTSTVKEFRKSHSSDSVSHSSRPIASNDGASGPTGRPMCSLKIKSKSRKPMLLMSRSMLLPSKSADNAPTAATSSDQESSPLSSQATLKLKAFGQKQRDRLAARLDKACGTNGHEIAKDCDGLGDSHGEIDQTRQPEFAMPVSEYTPFGSQNSSVVMVRSPDDGAAHTEAEECIGASQPPTDSDASRGNSSNTISRVVVQNQQRCMTGSSSIVGHQIPIHPSNLRNLSSLPSDVSGLRPAPGGCALVGAEHEQLTGKQKLTKAHFDEQQVRFSRPSHRHGRLRESLVLGVLTSMPDESVLSNITNLGASRPSRPPLANPASKNRKAAKKSDHLLLLGQNLGTQVPVAQTTHLMCQQLAEAKRSGQIPQARAVEIVDIGAWSRESGDLFDWTKPAIEQQ